MALYLGFGSEEADLVHAGDPVSTGIRIGVISGAVAFVAGVVALAWDGVRRGRAEGRIARRVAGALGLGLVAVLAGFLALLIVVQIAFA